jgi:hypothetical protein
MWLSVTAVGLTYWPGVFLGVSRQKRIAFYPIKRKLYPANFSPKVLTSFLFVCFFSLTFLQFALTFSTFFLLLDFSFLFYFKIYILGS